MKMCNKTRLSGSILAIVIFAASYIYINYINALTRREYKIDVTRAIVSAWDAVLMEEISSEMQSKTTMPQLIARFGSMDNKDDSRWDILKQFSDGTDVWGNPITFELATDGIATQLKLHSDGPNQTHDLGRGDDIERKRRLSRLR